MISPPSSPEFDLWFGLSHVVDPSNGLPLRVYHGTLYDFHTFTASAGEGNLLNGIYATPSTKVVDDYGDFEGGLVLPLYVSLQNPAYRPDLMEVEKIFRQDGQDDWPDAHAITAELINRGFDGYIEAEGRDGVCTASEIVAFFPNQLKSSIGNPGSYCGNMSHITDGNIIILGTKIDLESEASQSARHINSKKYRP